MRSIFIPLILLFVLTIPAQGAPRKVRPFSGSGLLVIRPPGEGEAGGPLVLYREPGVGRAAEKHPAELPHLAELVPAASGEYPVAVIRKRGNWVKIAYDDAGREGWLAMERRWDCTSWEEFLPGRTVRLLPGLKPEYGAARREPSPSAPQLLQLSPEMAFQVMQVQEDWLQVRLAPQATGWLRWRDDGGRLLIAVLGPEQ